MQPQDFGNFNFGVAARAYGFSELTGLVGAGVNQLGKGSKFYDLSNWEGFGDDKRDTFFIKLGYEWWNSTK